MRMSLYSSTWNCRLHLNCAASSCAMGKPNLIGLKVDCDSTAADAQTNAYLIIPLRWLQSQFFGILLTILYCNFIVKSFEKPIFAHETSHSDIVEWFLLGVAPNPSQTLCMPFKNQQTRQLKCVKYTICNGKQWDENAPNNVVVETKLPWREMWNGQASK